MKKSLFTFTNLKRNLIIIILVAVAVILLANKLLVWGAAFLAAGLIVLGIQQLIQLNVKVTKFEDNITGLEEKNQNLAKLNEKLSEENAFLKERHFQVTQIKSILELNMFEIDANLKRSIIKLEQKADRELKCLGCLNISLKAKYGIDYRELRFKYIPASDELIVANINPKFLSFGNRKLEWEFFEVLEHRSLIPLGGKRWMTGDDLSQYRDRIKEEIRLQTEQSLESGPEELSWIMGPISENVESTLRIMFKGVCSKIRIAERADDSFVIIDNISFNKLPAQNTLMQHETL